MKKILDALERRCGRFAVPHVTQALILGQVIVYVLNMTAARGNALANIQLSPAQALGGEPWRLITFLFVPPTAHPIFAFFFWYILFMMGTALERLWGTFRYNMYLLLGIVATLVVAFAIPQLHLHDVGNTFIYTTVFLAFAFLFPDFEFLIFFILPVKVKWLALLAWLGIAFSFVGGDWGTKAQVAASVANFLLFFGGDIFDRLRNKQRRKSWERKTEKPKKQFRHVCEVCGVSDRDDPKLQFRYCPDCEGQCGYCPAHIEQHEHVKA